MQNFQIEIVNTKHITSNKNHKKNGKANKGLFDLLFKEITNKSSLSKKIVDKSLTTSSDLDPSKKENVTILKKENKKNYPSDLNLNLNLVQSYTHIEPKKDTYQKLKKLSEADIYLKKEKNKTNISFINSKENERKPLTENNTSWDKNKKNIPNVSNLKENLHAEGHADKKEKQIKKIHNVFDLHGKKEKEKIEVLNIEKGKSIDTKKIKVTKNSNNSFSYNLPQIENKNKVNIKKVENLKQKVNTKIIYKEGLWENNVNENPNQIISNNNSINIEKDTPKNVDGKTARKKINKENLLFLNKENIFTKGKQVKFSVKINNEENNFKIYLNSSEIKNPEESSLKAFPGTKTFKEKVTQKDLYKDISNLDNSQSNKLNTSRWLRNTTRRNNEGQENTFSNTENKDKKVFLDRIKRLTKTDFKKEIYSKKHFTYKTFSKKNENLEGKKKESNIQENSMFFPQNIQSDISEKKIFTRMEKQFETEKVEHLEHYQQNQSTFDISNQGSSENFLDSSDSSHFYNNLNNREKAPEGNSFQKVFTLSLNFNDTNIVARLRNNTLNLSIILSNSSISYINSLKFDIASILREQGFNQFNLKIETKGKKIYYSNIYNKEEKREINVKV